MADMLAHYRPGVAFDEMVDPRGAVREPYALLADMVARMGPGDLRAIAETLSNNYLAAGVTFDVGGVERPFPLDVIPRIITARDWDIIERGVRQRVRALEAFLDDAYNDQQAVTDGVVPRSLITTSKHFHRVLHGMNPANGARVQVAGIDLIRTPAGDMRVLEDNVRVPSGVSYVMTNRTAMASVMPETMAAQRVRPVSDYAQHLLHALRAAAPDGIEDPTVVVLTPGVYNSAYFEHTLLARTMGVELVEGSDLECRRGRVHMRTTRGLRPVHVIYRRIDDDFIDPVHFRRDSLLGVPGIVNAVRTGGVALCNALGNGVADDKLVYTYVPDLIRYFLHEEPVLKNVDTWRLAEPAAREEVMDRLEELVVKPVDGSGGKGIVIGPSATAEQIATLRRRVAADPRGWIAQPLVQLSTVPTFLDEALRPRHVDLRPFAVHDGEDVWVLPGGLTRVALPEGELIVNSSRGGGSKDTWVIAGAPLLPGGSAGSDRPGAAAPSEGPDAAAPPDEAGEVESGAVPRAETTGIADLARLPAPTQRPPDQPTARKTQQEQQQQGHRHQPHRQRLPQKRPHEQPAGADRC
ncbi:circularly permuted type 2 ATP-grasp protein [Raineyella sp.]|uniref:circularly permuted type 2 ATP-grasp protein n=1 Tax=Raineyella sp. TaxID=1911550 RepID=UPI002B20F867|nr:circularly permuted type 2 ATP-grasp protein [Raineyella sp.]MEA5154964.1 circularly permuted type 2 ATP-grasp protein [Raineyella sp.]